MFVLVASQAAAAEPAEPTEAPAADDAPSVRFWLSHDQVIAFSKQAESVLSAGRPLCPRCGLPMDPPGHPCPVMNGARPIFRRRRAPAGRPARRPGPGPPSRCAELHAPDTPGTASATRSTP